MYADETPTNGHLKSEQTTFSIPDHCSTNPSVKDIPVYVVQSLHTKHQMALSGDGINLENTTRRSGGGNVSDSGHKSSFFTSAFLMIFSTKCERGLVFRHPKKQIAKSALMRKFNLTTS